MYASCVQRRGAPGLGQDEAASGTGHRPRDTVGGEMRLDRQVCAAGLEDREDGGEPVEVALRHHGDDAFAAQPVRQQGSCQPVRTAVELAVRPLPLAVDGRDGVRVCPNVLLEQLVDAAVRQLRAPAGEPVQLEVQLLRREQALPSVLGVRIRGDQLERPALVTRDPRSVRVPHVERRLDRQVPLVCRQQERAPRRIARRRLALACELRADLRVRGAQYRCERHRQLAQSLGELVGDRRLGEREHGHLTSRLPDCRPSAHSPEPPRPSSGRSRARAPSRHPSSRRSGRPWRHPPCSRRRACSGRI